MPTSVRHAAETKSAKTLDPNKQALLSAHMSHTPAVARKYYQRVHGLGEAVKVHELRRLSSLSAVKGRDRTPFIRVQLASESHPLCLRSEATRAKPRKLYDEAGTG